MISKNRNLNLNQILRTLLVGLLGLFILFGYTNCDIGQTLEAGNSGEFSRLALIGGDGEGLEGKLTYQRRVPGHSCLGQNMEYASLTLESKKSLLTVNTSNQCHQKSLINTADLQISPFTDSVIGYQDGIYAKTSSMGDHSFTEVWCENHSEEKEGMDMVVKWTRAGSSATSKFFNRTTGPKGSPPSLLKRDLSRAVILYTGPNFTLKIQRVRGGNPDHPHQNLGLLAKNGEETPMLCRLGGQFDSVAPKISYPFERIFTKNHKNVSIIPRTNKPINSYRITPKLPEGLSFDPTTGAISGSPVKLTSVQKFTIEALFNFGSVSSFITLGVGHQISVDSKARLDSENLPGDGTCRNSVSLCDLSSAIEEANALSPYPAIIQLPNEVIRLEGQHLEVTGHIQILGKKGTTIDGNFRSRIFQLQPKSHLWLHSVKLINGAPEGSGGAINGTDTSLSLDAATIQNNRLTYQDSRGGGINLINSSLTVRNSHFINNSTAPGGIDIVGGAINARYPTLFIIEDSTFWLNKSHSGGAIQLIGKHFDQYSIISNVTFEDNDAISGGAIYVEGPLTMIDQCQFQHNSSNKGGAIYTKWSTEIIIKRSHFTQNTAVTGSAIYNHGANWLRSTLYVLDSKFEDNHLLPWLSKTKHNYVGTTIFTTSDVTKIGNSQFYDGPQSANCGDYGTLGAKNFDEDRYVDLGGNEGDDDSCKFGIHGNSLSF